MQQIIINILTFPYSILLTYALILSAAGIIGFIVYKRCDNNKPMRDIAHLMIIATLTIAVSLGYHFGALTAADKYNESQIENANIYVDVVGHIITTPDATEYHTSNLDTITVHNRDHNKMHDTIEPGTTITYKLYNGLTKNTFSYDKEERAEIISTKVVMDHYLSEYK